MGKIKIKKKNKRLDCGCNKRNKEVFLIDLDGMKYDKETKRETFHKAFKTYKVCKDCSSSFYENLQKKLWPQMKAGSILIMK